MNRSSYVPPLAAGAVIQGLSLFLSALTSVEASAGPNAGGTLLLHVDPAISYTESGDPANFCGLSGLPDCDQVVATTDASGPPLIAWVLATFHPTLTPRLAGTAFGIDYDPSLVSVLAHGACGDFELSTDSWPEPGEGTAVVWYEAQTESVTEVYWLALYIDGDIPTSLDLIAHPGQGAVFASDGVPSIQDPVLGLGRLGFAMQGFAPCPEIVGPVGACCLTTGGCVVLREDECTAGGDRYLGDDVSCQPDPCPAPVGACCDIATGACSIRTESSCAGSQFGEYVGHGTECEPRPCDPVGACCTDFGFCVLYTAYGCEYFGGVYHGDGSECSPDLCPVGACCLPQNGCMHLTEEGCADAGGSYAGDGSTCTLNPCPPEAACCLQNGGCLVLTAEQCTAQEGIFHLESPSCVPNPCPASTGACCFGIECEVLTASECEIRGGWYLGNDVPCVHCMPVHTTIESWGRIKSLYHP